MMVVNRKCNEILGLEDPEILCLVLRFASRAMSSRDFENCISRIFKTA
jgi:hypothetical protein